MSCRLHGRTSSVLLDDEDDEDGCGGDVACERTALNPAASSSGCSSPMPPIAAADLPPYDHSNCSLALHKSCACINFIAEHTKAKEEATKVITMISTCCAYV